MANPPAGILFLVSTPIGNLEDISLRALRVLGEADLIAAEDTRHSAKLLHRYDIRRPTTSLHEHNEAAKVPSLVDSLLGGARIALVTDAGTPSVSDPGFRLVRAAIDAGIRVEAIPGPSAALTALVASGLPTDAFVFAGFPPPRAAARRAWLEALQNDRRTLVFFEAPHRIRETLEDIVAVLGDRQAAIGRELTKVHEEFLRGPVSSILAGLTSPQGEFTVVLAGLDEDKTKQADKPDDRQLFAEFCLLTEKGLTRREAIAGIARTHAMRSRDVFAALDRARRS